MKRYLIIILAFGIGGPIFSQANIFLDRDFWASKPSVETIDLKIKEGHDIAQANASNFDGAAQAILANAPNETIQYVITKKGNDVNKLTHDGRTYIFWAANKGNVELMQFLIDNGAKTDITDDKGSSIINFAAGSGQRTTQVYDLLIKYGANLQKDLTPTGANALLLVAPHDTDFSLITYFTSKGLDLNSVDADGNGIFNYAARTGNITLMTQLLKKGVKGNDNAFIFASQGARGITNGIEVYQFLESAGLNPIAVSKDGETALHTLAVRSKDMAIINYFIQKGADVNQSDSFGNTPFMNAASKNNLETVTLFSKTVKNINQTNKKGESALALAVANNISDVVAFLLNKKAKTLLVDGNGNDLTTYLMQSYTVKNEDDFNKKLSLLEQNGFNFGKPQANGNTLYHLALDKNDMTTLKFIQQFKADVNAKNKEGITPLHKAAMKANDTEILKYLVSIGAKKDIVTDFDETAYDLASENELLIGKNISLDFLK
ncbi:ankyrin repeat domain-containing protein [Gelidibacter sp.]|uniref:ankyrin repeat domain-containing protein n=1 Tax=Gelidibacter sp. TaxID=2018083 RepID=UPI003265C4F0